MLTHRNVTLASVLALLLGLAACGQPATPHGASAPPAAQAAPAPQPAAAPSVADLRGARASSGESEMQTRGFTVARQRG